MWRDLPGTAAKRACVEHQPSGYSEASDAARTEQLVQQQLGRQAGPLNKCAKSFDDTMMTDAPYPPLLVDEDLFPSPLQQSGAIRDVFAEHILGTLSFLYSIDPGRESLADAATEIRHSSLRNAALVCSAWHGCAAATFEWEKQRYIEEKRLLLDPYVQPLTSGVHLAPCKRTVIYDVRSPTILTTDRRSNEGSKQPRQTNFTEARTRVKPNYPDVDRSQPDAPENLKLWVDPPRFARLPFKEGDVLIVNAIRLSEACEALYEESPSSEPLQQIASETAAVLRSLESRVSPSQPRRPAAGRGWVQRTVTPPDELSSADADTSPRGPSAQRRSSNRQHLLRCRVSRLNVVALPRRRSPTEWWRARGPGGRVVIEVGVERQRADVCAAADDDAEPLFEIADPRDFSETETACTEDLIPTVDELHRSFKAMSTKNFGPIAYSLPLPLLDPGVIVRVVPACYRSPRLDWPSFEGRPVPIGSTFCSIRGRPQVLMGYARELRSSRRVAFPPPQTDSPIFSDDRPASGNLNSNSQVNQPPPVATQVSAHTGVAAMINHIASQYPTAESRIRHVLYVRDAASGHSMSGEAAFWGMSAWDRREFLAYDSPLPLPRGIGDSIYTPPSLAHLVLDCTAILFEKNRTYPTINSPEVFGSPKCVVCSKPLARRSSASTVALGMRVALPCGCADYCSTAHARVHRSEHNTWCLRARMQGYGTALQRSL